MQLPDYLENGDNTPNIQLRCFGQAINREFDLEDVPAQAGSTQSSPFLHFAG